VVWGCEGKGQAAADVLFEELDLAETISSPNPTLKAGSSPAAEQPEIIVPFGPCPTERCGRPQHPGRVVGARPRIDATLFPPAARPHAVSMDMTGGYAKSVRQRAPQAVVCIDSYHVVQLANQALDEVRRGYWNELRSFGDNDAAKHFKDARWSLLKEPEKLTDKQAATGLDQPSAAGPTARNESSSRPRNAPYRGRSLRFVAAAREPSSRMKAECGAGAPRPRSHKRRAHRHQQGAG